MLKITLRRPWVGMCTTGWINTHTSKCIQMISLWMLHTLIHLKETFAPYYLFNNSFFPPWIGMYLQTCWDALIKKYEKTTWFEKHFYLMKFFHYIFVRNLVRHSPHKLVLRLIWNTMVSTTSIPAILKLILILSSYEANEEKLIIRFKDLMKSEFSVHLHR